MGMFGSLFEKLGISGKAKIPEKIDSDVADEYPEREKKQPGESGLEPKGKDYQVGDRIAGKYEVYRILGGEGQSGMGIVYVCYDHEFKQVLALKTFQEKYLSSKQMKDSFKREAFAWVHLDRHAFIVKAEWVQELDYRMFVGAEFIAPDEQGRNTLSHYLNRPISLKQALTWCIQFCHGMEHAFKKGVTPHRDIKPDNIMITKDGVVKITDFGLAGLWEETDVSVDLEELNRQDRAGLTFIRKTGGKIIGGTPPWMAPEQFEGQADVRSDIYSFGIVLYQMINQGKLPFYPGPGDTWKQAHRTCPVPEMDSLLFSMAKRCLHKDPARRYPTFQELRNELEQLYAKEITSRTGEAVPSAPERAELEAWELSNKGLSLNNLGLHDQAISCYGEAIRINPEDAQAHNNLGAVLKDKGRHDEGIACYREAIRINPEYAFAHYNLGAALQDKGRHDEAIACYREALRINPEFAQAHNNLGAALKDKGRHDEAIACYREAIRINPEDAEAHYNLGNALKAKGLVDPAISCYREAIRINPEFAQAHFNLGIALKDKGLLDQAISCYRKAIRINPEVAQAHFNLGIAFYAKGLHDQAISCYREALRLNPEYVEAHNNLGTALADKGLLDEAISCYREALRLNPEYVEAHNNLGIALYEKGLHNKAISCYREALRLNPEYVEAHNNLGNALGSKGLLDKAIVCYREVLRINPEDALAHYNLGIVLAKTGLLDDAVVKFEGFIRYAPSHYAGHVAQVKAIIKDLKAETGKA